MMLKVVCPLRAADLPGSGQLVITNFYSSMRKYIILNVQWRLNIVCPLRAADLPDCGPPGLRISCDADLPGYAPTIVLLLHSDVDHWLYLRL